MKRLWFVLLFILGLVVGMMLASVLIMSEASAQQPPFNYHGRVARVVDGDTFYISVEGGQLACPQATRCLRKVRIADIDAPETSSRAKCERERTRGAHATLVLTNILRTDLVEVRVRKIDRYHRDFGYVFHNGIDVGARMMELGHALPWLDRMPKPDHCNDPRQ